MHDIAFGYKLLLRQLKTIVLIQRDIAFLVGFQIAHHIFIVAKLQHRAHKLTCDALSLCILLDGQVK